MDLHEKWVVMNNAKRALDKWKSGMLYLDEDTMTWYSGSPISIALSLGTVISSDILGTEEEEFVKDLIENSDKHTLHAVTKAMEFIIEEMCTQYHKDLWNIRYKKMTRGPKNG